jgi:hypothetical protein
VSYLLVSGTPRVDTTTKIARYLPDLCTISAVYEDDPVWVAVVPRDMTQWCVDRLGSGLINAQVCESLKAAEQLGADEVWRLRK